MGGIANSIGNMFSGQSNFHGQGADITNPLESGQQQAAYDTLTGALSGQQKLAQQLGQVGGIQNQQSVFGQQQQLANALQMQANGQGPNPAQAALAQSTAANTANQAALMAGQRGSGANAGLIARQAAQQGGANQQMAVGQGATMQAQQQIAAQQALASQQAQMQGVAQNQIGNQITGVGNYTNAAQANESSVQNALANYNNAKVGMAANMNNTNEAAIGGAEKITAGAIGGLANAAGGKAAAKAYGGKIEDPHMMKVHQLWHGGNYADGGKVDVMVSPGEKYIEPDEAEAVAMGEKSIAQAGEKIPGTPKMSGDHLENDTVHKKLEAGGIVIPNSVMQSEDPVKEGTKFLMDALKKHGGKKEKSDFHAALKKAASARG